MESAETEYEIVRDLNPDDGFFGCLHPRETYVRKSDGAIHRDNGPARIVRHMVTGVILQEEYYCDHQLHRAGDKPALLRYLDDGRLVDVTYYNHGRVHRDENLGPAWIIYRDAELNPDLECYKSFNRAHRSGGLPAYISYNEDGSVQEVAYYHFGECQDEKFFYHGVSLESLTPG